MFKNHPRGLIVLFMTEIWERFGFYTVLSIFVLYLNENFHWNEATIGNVYGLFIATTFFLPLIGGWIADRFLGYSRTIIIGLFTMATGYALLATPTNKAWLLFLSLAVIASGTGLYKANIYVLVGNLYTESNAALKDAAFSIFYMGINIGAFLGPIAASSIKNFMLTHYHVTLARAYNAGFGAASVGMLLAITIFLSFRKYHRMADYRVRKELKNKEGNKAIIQGMDLKYSKPEDPPLNLSAETYHNKEEKDRLISLLIIFLSVIFFWMGYYQNGYTLTLFAKDYTSAYVGRFTYLFFNPVSLLSILALLLALSSTLRKSSSKKSRITGFAVILLALIVMTVKLISFNDVNQISPESFQVFNPLFIIFLTPILVSLFSYLRKRGMEPSSPAKMAAGMNLEALSFVIMIAAAASLPPFGRNNSMHFGGVSPYWLISSYFVITLAELFLSPIGLSFVSKVAPARMKGAMMGAWFAAQATGSYLSGFVGRFYGEWQQWQFFLLLVFTSLLSGGVVIAYLKRLKSVSGS
ncbi:MAG: peptide MFS transporter [Candidatus Kryptoniota bacterium]